MDKDKKKKIIIISSCVAAAVLLIIVVVAIVVGSKSKDEPSDADLVVSTQDQSNSKWPNLEKESIPNFKKGKIGEVIDSSNMSGYKLNYKIEVDSLKAEDIESYVEEFDKKEWETFEAGNNTILLNVNNQERKSVFINYNEDTEKAEIVVSSRDE